MQKAYTNGVSSTLRSGFLEPLASLPDDLAFVFQPINAQKGQFEIFELCLVMRTKALTKILNQNKVYYRRFSVVLIKKWISN